MLVWAIYDITSDKARRKIVKACKKAGLYRVQKSVFLGNIEPNDLDELYLFSSEQINPKTDSVYIFQMTEKNFKATKTLGLAFDKDLVTDEIRELFL